MPFTMQPEDFELRSIETLRDRMPAPTVLPPQHGLVKKGRGDGMRYRFRSACLLAIYFPLLVLPWVLTAIMMFRPINFPSFFDPSGSITPRHLATLENWQAAVRVLRTIAVTISLPIVSALLAQGAIVFTQRSRPNQHLNVLQLFSLADKTWMSPLRLWHLPKSAVSLYLWLAAGLIIITALQPFLQSILIEDESRTIVTCRGHPDWWDRWDRWDRWRSKSYDECLTDGISGALAGWDPEPVELANCPQALVVQETLERLTMASSYDTQTYLWCEQMATINSNGAGRRNFASIYSKLGYEPLHQPYFASSITSDTSTGVYRAHAARMDSTAKCTNVTASTFPKTCPGDAPFETSFSHPEAKINICVEGNSEKTPWTTSRDKQEHSERIWLKLNTNERYSEQEFTLKCESTSRRGWFELPNRKNNYVAGSLLDVWPSQEELKREFNDYSNPWHSVDVYPQTKDANRKTEVFWTIPTLPFSLIPTIEGGQHPPTPGPLMTAALAMFGNTSAFHAAVTAKKEAYNDTVRQICQQLPLPLSRFDLLSSLPSDDHPCWRFGDGANHDPELQEVIGEFFRQFYDVNSTAIALEVAMLFANEALLTLTATDNKNAGGRVILSSPGDRITKPKKSVPGLVIISLLIFLQVAGLGFLVAFIYSSPTWTSNLDSDALTQIGVQIQDLGGHRRELEHVCGLVGVVETQRGDDDSSLRTAVVETVQLGLGGKGMISKETMRAMRSHLNR